MKAAQESIGISLDALIHFHFVAKKLSLFAKQKAGSPLAGQYMSSLYGRGLDFAETRAYTPGDDIRTMDWRVLARTGKPHTKRFHEEKERPVYFAIDYNPSMFFGTRTTFKSVIAAEATAILAWAASYQHDKVGGIVFCGDEQIELRPKTGKRGVLPLLKQLANTESAPNNTPCQKSFSLALMRLRSVCKPGSLVYLLSDFSEFDETHCAHLAALSKHNRICSLIIRDPLEMAPPEPGYYTISDGNDHTLSFGTFNEAQQKAYYDALLSHYEFVEKRLKGFKIPIVPLQTNSNVVDIITHHALTHKLDK